MISVAAFERFIGCPWPFGDPRALPTPRSAGSGVTFPQKPFLETASEKQELGDRSEFCMALHVGLRVDQTGCIP